MFISENQYHPRVKSRWGSRKGQCFKTCYPAIHIKEQSLGLENLYMFKKRKLDSFSSSVSNSFSLGKTYKCDTVTIVTVTL